MEHWGIFLALGLSILVSGPTRAIHEAPLHDDACGLNAWSQKRFAVSRPKLHHWLDQRYSHTNKHRFAREITELLPGWLSLKWRTRLGSLFTGPLVCFTDLWHLSYTLSNLAGNIALLVALAWAPPLWWPLAALVVFTEDILFEPTYRALRKYRG